MWVKFKIVTADGEIIYNELKVPVHVYKKIVREIGLASLTEQTNDEWSKSIYLELQRYSSKLHQIYLGFNLK